MGREERCETCRFRESTLSLDEFGKWNPTDKRIATGWPVGGYTEAEYENLTCEPTGECHRYPPDGDGFPAVNLGEWCGEWQARKPLPVVEGS